VVVPDTPSHLTSTQSEYLIERLGGPKLYTQRRGSTSLIGRHAPYRGVTHEAAARWLQHMDAALLGVPEIDAEARAMLQAFFAFHAAYIVEGRTLLNPDRLIGYGGSVHVASAHGGRETQL
jgi:truncated hemoglobin YjbI